MTEFFSPPDLAFIAVITSAFVAILTGLMVYQSRTDNLRARAEMQRVEIELLRSSFESKIYDLNARLTSTSNRWRDVNGLIVEGSSSLETEVRDSPAVDSLRFLDGLGVKASATLVNPRKVFILTPFHEDFLGTYQQIYKVISSLGLVVARGDEVFLESNILSHIVQEILSSAIVIANIDGRNPNVFYELGISHALGKPSIILSSSLDDVPFDLRNQAVVFWKDLNDLDTGLTKAVARFGLRTRQR